LSAEQAAIADKILEEIRQRLLFLDEVGLDYLSLDRLSSTLSGGEAQRIQLATSLGSHLVGALIRVRRAFHRPASARHASLDRHPEAACATWATRSSWSSTIRT
jgi:ABC-type hemin transport system ATPase subunit